MNAEHLSDGELINMIRNPETNNYGFFLLVQKYQIPLLKSILRLVLRREDAEDLLQETFIKVYRKIDQLQSAEKLPFWIKKTAHHEALMFLRRKKIYAWIHQTELKKELNAILQDDPMMSGDQMQFAFQQSLLQLGTKQRAIFNMKYFEEMKYEEIAAIMGNSVNTCKATYHQCVKKIEKYLKTL